MGLDNMSITESHAKKRATKMTAAEKKEAQMAANRKAQLQWYAVGAVLVAAIIIAIVLITIYTEGEIPYTGGPSPA